MTPQPVSVLHAAHQTDSPPPPHPLPTPLRAPSPPHAPPTRNPSSSSPSLQLLPVSSEQLPVSPELLPVSPELLPVSPELLPVSPELLPISPELLPVSPELLPVSPELLPVSPELLSVSPELLPVSPELLPVSLQPVPISRERDQTSAELPLDPAERLPVSSGGTPALALEPRRPEVPSEGRPEVRGHWQGYGGDVKPGSANTNATHSRSGSSAENDATMGVGEGEGGPNRPATIKKAAFSTPALLPNQQERPQHHHNHHRHHSDPDPGHPLWYPGPLARAADDVMHQQQFERDKRLKQIDSRTKMTQDKASRSAPQRGRCITVAACNQTNPRPQRWSLGGPLTGTSWDIMLGTSNHPPNGVPTLSLPTQQQQQQQQSKGDTDLVGHGTTDLCHRNHQNDQPVFTDHLVRFVYPERDCRGWHGLEVGVQVSAPPPLQLRVLPEHRYGCRRRHNDGQQDGVEGVRPRTACEWLLQAVFCLAGLAVIILGLALAGAAAFHATEGPHEDLQVTELNKAQADLVVQLATDLRVISPVTPDDSAWRAAIERSVESHEQMVLRAAAAGYGEGGAGEDGARIWTYPGGLLFAASLLTTLGFGAPVPRTPMGRLSAVLIAVLGIPLNVILALQLGRLLCTRLPRLLPFLSPQRNRNTPHPAKKRALCSVCWPVSVADRCETTAATGRSSSETAVGFRWAPLLLPVGSLLVYYMLGMIAFSAVLALPADEWLVFPLSLTAAGGVARVPGWVRVCYAAYLEGGVLLAAVAVALLQGPATTATTDFAMSLGILDLDEYYSA